MNRHERRKLKKIEGVLADIAQGKNLDQHRSKFGAELVDMTIRDMQNPVRAAWEQASETDKAMFREWLRDLDVLDEIELEVDPHFERADLMEQLERVAADHFDGHVTILRFTTNWRVGFGTPSDRFDIDKYAVGETFEDAAREALAVFSGESPRFFYDTDKINCALDEAQERCKSNMSAKKFLHNIRQQFRDYGHLTMNQYEAVLRVGH